MIWITWKTPRANHSVDIDADPSRWQRGDVLTMQHHGQLVQLRVEEKIIPVDLSEPVQLHCFPRCVAPVEEVLS
jgi:hypothetical protein